MDTNNKKLNDKIAAKSKKTKVKSLSKSKEQLLDEYGDWIDLHHNQGKILVGPPVAGHTLQTIKDVVETFSGHDELTNFDDGSFDPDVTQKQPSHGARKPMFPRTVDGMKFEKWGGVATGVEWIDKSIRDLWKAIEENPIPQCLYHMTGDKMVMLYYTEEGEIMIAVNKVLGMFQCDHSKLKQSIGKTNPKNISLESKRIKDMDIE